MRLYELGNNKRFTLTDDDSGTVFLLDHQGSFQIDGAYSVCYLGDAMIHISAFAEIKVVDQIAQELEVKGYFNNFAIIIYSLVIVFLMIGFIRWGI